MKKKSLKILKKEDKSKYLGLNYMQNFSFFFALFSLFFLMMKLFNRAAAPREALGGSLHPSPIEEIELCLLLINIHEKTWLLQLKTTTF